MYLIGREASVRFYTLHQRAEIVTLQKGKKKCVYIYIYNHRNHIKKGVSSCELTEHFLHNKRTHDFNNNVTITIIEQIRKDHLETDKKKEVLREREIFWQRTLNSFQPYGLNKRTG